MNLCTAAAVGPSVRRVVLAFCTVFTLSAAFAAEFVLAKAPQSLADWKSGDFYDNGGGVPGAGDIVELPAGMTAKVDDESIAFVSTFARIKPMAKDTSVLLVDVATVADLGCAVYYDVRKDSGDKGTRGKIVKVGPGLVTLAAPNLASAYFTDMDVQEGCLALTPRGTIQDRFYGRINVGANGLLVPGADASNITQNWMLNLTGSGVVSNGVGDATRCRILPGSGDGFPVEFSGRILDRIHWYSHGNEWLTGTDSTFSGGFRIQSNGGGTVQGITGVKKFGMKADESSSMGRSPAILMVEFGGRVLYLGDGETTDKDVQVASSSGDAAGNPGVIDAGATGGVTFTGRIYPVGAGCVERLVLTGSNVNECVMAGAISPYTESGKTHNFYVSKKGTGTWRLTDSTARGAILGLGVEEGTLAFDSLAEKGTMCAIGNGSVFTVDERCISESDRKEVPYQFKLGTATTRGNLAFTGSGTDPVSCTTRPIALAGDGGLANDSQASSFTFGGVSSIVAGCHMFTLFGDAAQESFATDISDGVGTVGVAKEGTGTWTLLPASAFTGPIDVKEGKLVLRGTAGRKFTWYRWTIRQMRYPDLNPPQSQCQINICEFGFYDANGDRVGANLKMPGTGSVLDINLNPEDYGKLGIGEVALGRKLEEWDWGNGSQHTLDKMFNDVSNGDNYMCILPRTYVSGAKQNLIASTNDPSTWVSFVMRLDPAENEVCSYDVACWGTKAGSFPRSWYLEGSVDGKTWSTCHDIDAAPWPSSGSYSSQWSFSGGGNDNKTTSPASHHTGGQAIVGHSEGTAFVCTNLCSVAAGATLEAEGFVELRGLRLRRSGNGTFRGFSIGEIGTLDFDGMAAGASVVTLPATFDGVTGLDNLASWSVSLNGTAKPGYSIRIVDGQVTVMKSGLMLLVR